MTIQAKLKSCKDLLNRTHTLNYLTGGGGGAEFHLGIVKSLMSMLSLLANLSLVLSQMIQLSGSLDAASAPQLHVISFLLAPLLVRWSTFVT